MPAPAPDELKDEREQWLWLQMARLYEDYCGDDAAVYPALTESFVKVSDLVQARLMESKD